MKRISISALVLLLCLTVLAGCSSEASVQDYIDATQGQISKAQAAVSDMVEMSFKDEDGVLVYECKYIVDLGMTIEETKLQIDSDIGTMQESFDTLLVEMKDFGIKNPKLIVRYIAMDGTVISSYTYE